MFLQEFVRGMRGLSWADAQDILNNGMQCQALRNAPGRSVWDVERDLTDANLDRHRHDYANFGPISPYISTTAGTYFEHVQILPGGEICGFNQAMFAFDTALQFAVLTARSDGWIFYGYHFLLGRPAGHHAEFSEEVRDYHQHPEWSRYRGEGEIAAAVRIPARRIRRAECYRYDEVMRAMWTRDPIQPLPGDVIDNAAYMEPELLLAPRAVI